MKLYDPARVESVEATAEFAAARAASATRRSGALAGVETKRLNAEETAYTIEIPPISPLLEAELIRRACANYNSHRRANDDVRGRDDDFDRATPDSDPEFLVRICVNYLRHGCTPYDAELARFSGKVGTDEARDIIRSRVLERIREAYPALAAECDRQEFATDRHEG